VSDENDQTGIIVDFGVIPGSRSQTNARTDDSQYRRRYNELRRIKANHALDPSAMVVRFAPLQVGCAF
jgi:hypothetical protein